MINPSDFVFNSDFNYMPTIASGSSPVTGTLTTLKTGVEGVPMVQIRLDMDTEIILGSPYLYLSMPKAVLRDGTLYADTGNTSGISKVAWRIHGA